MTETLVALFTAHVIANFVFQARESESGKRYIWSQVVRGAITLCSFILITGSASWPVLVAVAVNYSGHFLRTNKRLSFRIYILGEVACLATLAAVAYCYPDIWAQGFWNFLPVWTSHALLGISGAIYVTVAGGTALNRLMVPFSERLSAESGVLLQSGKIIGNLERGIVAALILTDHWEAIGFLLAAKVVMRFQTRETTIEENEYVYIGTLASFGWAILVTLAIHVILSQLPPLGFLPGAP